ncbi:MAG: phosphoribosylformimino-5-aminoimidazole carboxamide ribotide isomerase [Anaerovoracaceae bacterium]|nr:phosphoribosylformimino-5-aminoimidazole carboxamide ribotide isomerase [Bacillota bacterium]MDY2670914.1 phosphoribosylformimino-5-aminoimidazole carboxamide ribotide isomerase [Anaerovoracaceae bacterium]
MKFRPCIDIHNGKVKQIVGGSLDEQHSSVRENFVSERGGAYYASLYRRDGLKGGHIILLNPAGTPEYQADIEQAKAALGTYPGGMQIGGGITADNAADFINMGASHIIVTSYVFRNGKIDMERLEKLKSAVGRDHLVLDLSCRVKGDSYYIVTDRWQKFTEVEVTAEALDALSEHCSEFLVHAVDAEGKKGGADEKLAKLLSGFDGCPVTYAGGVGSFEDLEKLDRACDGKLDVTIGSALDLYGGNMPYDRVVEICAR